MLFAYQHRKAIAEFVALIHEASSYAGELRRVVETIVERSGIIGALQAENSDEAAGRIENIQELFGVVDEYVQSHDDDDALFEPPSAEQDENGGSRKAYPFVPFKPNRFQTSPNGLCCVPIWTL